MLGEKSKLEPLDHLMGAAYGWGGNPREAAIYVNRVPKLNDRTAKRDPDGGWTIRFGGDPTAQNVLPITPGWNHIARLYRPRKALLDGSRTFPVEVPATK